MAEAHDESEGEPFDVRVSASWWPRSAPRRRLIGHLISYGSELSERMERGPADPSEDPRFQKWSAACRRLLERAREQAVLLRGNVSVGYQALNAAHRMESLEFNEHEVRAAALELAEEAKSSKLPKWRRDAIHHLLRSVWCSRKPLPSVLRQLAANDAFMQRVLGLLRTQTSERQARVEALVIESGLQSVVADAVAGELLDLSEEGTTADAVRAVLERLASTDLAAARIFLRRATLVRDEGLQNEYRKTDILKQNLWIVSAFMALAIIAILVLAWFLPLELSGLTQDADRELGGRILVYVPLFGLLGACLSATLSLIRTSRRRGIPEIAAHGVTTVVRPLFGAGASLVAFVLVVSGLQEFVSTSNAAVLFVAFAAGFSERLIVRAVAAVGGEQEPTPSSGPGG